MNVKHTKLLALLTAAALCCTAWAVPVSASGEPSGEPIAQAAEQTAAEASAEPVIQTAEETAVGYAAEAGAETSAEPGEEAAVGEAAEILSAAVDGAGDETGYTITYNLNGGTMADADTVTDAAALPAVLPAPTKDGYAFGGWYTDAGLTAPAVPGAAIGADTPLYAAWIGLVTVSWEIVPIQLSEQTVYDWNPETLRYDAADSEQIEVTAQTPGTVTIRVSNTRDTAVNCTIQYTDAQTGLLTHTAVSPTAAAAAAGADGSTALYTDTISFADITAEAVAAVTDGTAVSAYTVTLSAGG